MATTSPDNLYYPVGTDGIAPLQTILANMQSSTQTALNGLGTKFPPVVGSDAARAALFPAPAQGSRVFRSDKMFTEAYYAAWSASNTSGARVAGWYPIDGIVYGKVTGSSSQSVTSANLTLAYNTNNGTYPGMWANTAPTRLILPIVGLWEVEGFVTTGGLDGAVLRSQIAVNGTGQVDTFNNVSGIGGLNDPFVKPRGVIPVTATTTYVEMIVSEGGKPSGTIVGGYSLWAKYLGPERF